MATTESTPTEAVEPPAVQPVPAPASEWARLNVRIPVGLHRKLEMECDARMISPALLVSKALELLLDDLPPVP